MNEKQNNHKPLNFHQKELLRMYESLTNDDVIAENKRKFDRKQRIEDKKEDYGL